MKKFELKMKLIFKFIIDSISSYMWHLMGIMFLVTFFNMYLMLSGYQEPPHKSASLSLLNSLRSGAKIYLLKFNKKPEKFSQFVALNKNSKHKYVVRLKKYINTADNSLIDKDLKSNKLTIIFIEEEIMAEYFLNNGQVNANIVEL